MNYFGYSFHFPFKFISIVKIGWGFGNVDIFLQICVWYTGTHASAEWNSFMDLKFPGICRFVFNCATWLITENSQDTLHELDFFWTELGTDSFSKLGQCQTHKTHYENGRALKYHVIIQLIPCFMSYSKRSSFIFQFN